MDKNEFSPIDLVMSFAVIGERRFKHTAAIVENRIEEDVVEFCKNKVLDKKSLIYRKGKNWYIENGAIKITINATSYTIITAHTIK